MYKKVALTVTVFTVGNHAHLYFICKDRKRTESPTMYEKRTERYLTGKTHASA